MSYRLDHIALLVRDLDESVAFLTGVLGLEEGVNPMGGTISAGSKSATAAASTSRPATSPKCMSKSRPTSP